MDRKTNPTAAVITRRRLFGLAGAGATSLLLAGCVGPGTTAGGNASPTGKATSAFSGKPTGTVSFYHWRGEDKATFDTLIGRFEKANPKVKINMTITTSTDYTANALQRVRDGGLGDVLPAFRGAQFHNMVEASVFQDLTGQQLIGNYVPDLISAGQSSNKQYGMPYQLLLLEPITNEDAFDKAGANPKPKDWNSTMDACEKLKSAGYTPIGFPGAVNTADGAQLFNSMVLGVQPSSDACAQIESGKYKLTDAWFLNLLNKYKEIGQYFQPNFMGASMSTVNQLFVSGKTAMLAAGSYNISVVRSLGATFPIGMFFPVSLDTAKSNWFKGTFNATFIMGVNSASKVKPAALKWVEFLSEPDQAEYYANQTTQWLTMKGINYTNPDLKRLAPILKEKIELAPRYQFLNTNVANAVFNACAAAAAGTSPDQAAEQGQKIVDQARQQS